MRIIERYILRQIALGYVLISILLLGLFGFFDLGTQLDDVGKGVYSTRDALFYTLLSMPQRVADLMPFTALLATIAALGIMAQRHELVILRSAGISVLRIATIVLKAGAVLLAINIALQTYVAPRSQQYANQMRAAAIAGHHTDFSDSFWMRSHHGVIHIGGLRDGRIPVDVEFYRFSTGHTLRRYIHAASADTISGHHWRLHDVLIKRLDTPGTHTTRQPLLNMDPELYPDQLRILKQSPDALSLQSLYRYARYLAAEGQNARPFRVAFWQKIALLLTTLAMMLFALPLTFANPRSAQLGLRLVIGGLLGLGIYAAAQATANLALLLALDPALLTLAPGVLFIAMALFWLRRIN